MYNLTSESFTNEKPPICQSCAEWLMAAAVNVYGEENPNLEACDLNVIVDTKRKVVVVNHIPCSEYSWKELGFTGC